MLRESKEDLLTADVFGVLKYLPRRPFLEAVLRAIGDRNPHAVEYHVHLDAFISSLDDAAFNFWPSYPTPRGLEGNMTEPDVELTGPQTLMLVEAKLASGFAETQVERELAAAVNAATGRQPFLLLVTPSSMPPRFGGPKQRLKAHDYLLNLAVDGTLPRSLSRRLAANARRVLWISWDGILRAMQSALNTFSQTAADGGSRPGDLVSDLTTLMAMRGIQPFAGFGTVVAEPPPAPSHHPLLGFAASATMRAGRGGFGFDAVVQNVPIHLGWACPRPDSRTRDGLCGVVEKWGRSLVDLADLWQCPRSAESGRSGSRSISINSLAQDLPCTVTELRQRPILRDRGALAGLRFASLVRKVKPEEPGFRLFNC